MNTFISPQGYSIVKESLSVEALAQVKEDLTVKPYVYNGQANAYKLYQEGPTKLYVPKFYGLSKFGAPTVNKLKDGTPINVPFTGQLRPIQQDAVKCFLDATKLPDASGGLLNLTCASGKCLAKDTPVLMYSGAVKKVQDIDVGDQVMGDDGTPRQVLSTCRGWESLYTVKQDIGDAYTVNGSHILSLMYEGKIIDIGMSAYLKHPDKHRMRGYKRFVEFPEKPVDIPAYEMGRLCRDGRPIPPNYRANTRQVMEAFVKGMFEDGPVKATKDLAFMVSALGYEHEVQDGTMVLGTRHVGEVAYAISVSYAAHGEYFGFLLDGNHRFLLGDMTVTHNTVMAIYLMCKLAQKSLVIVHKDFLLEQWRERIAQFAPAARIGLIKAKTIDVDADIVLASLQSLSMKEYPKETFEGFGLVVIDEVHHTSAEVFSQALRKVAFKYTLGLSATMTRKDGLSRVFKWFLGDVLYSNVKKKNKDVVHVQCEYFYEPVPAYSEEYIYKKLNISKMINNICEYVPRLSFLGELILKVFAKEPGRRMIVLSDRRRHIEDLGDWLKTHDISCGYYLGGMRITDLKDSEQCRVILGTYCMVSEGFDCKHLDTLVLASPKSDVVQSVGRILRLEAHERKHTPLVIDLIDNFSIFARQGKKRLAYYKTQGYKIEGERVVDYKLAQFEGCAIQALE